MRRAAARAVAVLTMLGATVTTMLTAGPAPAAHAASVGLGDFVLQVARELPPQATVGLLGVPIENREQLFEWSNRMIGDDYPEFAEYDSLGSAGEMMWYPMQLAERKAKERDLTSVAPPERLRSSMINGIKHWRVDYRTR